MPKYSEIVFIYKIEMGGSWIWE